MNVYRELSHYYKDIFPVADTDLRFWVNKFAVCGRILDMGCGVGNKTIFFAKPGRLINGIDLDPEMIRRAKEENDHPDISYEVLNMQDIDLRFEPNTFDGLICLGNTLVHVDDTEELQDLLLKMSLVLKPGGLCLIQILNYDMVLDTHLEALPVIETEHCTFERAYRKHGQHLRFVTTLTYKDRPRTLINNCDLYPLRQSELIEGLRQTGFERPELYGSYQGGRLTADSLPLLALCRNRKHREA